MCWKGNDWLDLYNKTEQNTIDRHVQNEATTSAFPYDTSIDLVQRFHIHPYDRAFEKLRLGQ